MNELGSLVRRDHDDLHYALRVMTEPLSDEKQVLAMLDRVRSMFPSHAEAEVAAFNAMLETQPEPVLYFLASQVIAAHLAQETVLDELVRLRPGTPQFRERAQYLRHLMVHHAEHEAACLHPALPDHLPHGVAATMAQNYSIERDRLLAAHVDTCLRDVG
jgi:hypothetical protein